MSSFLERPDPRHEPDEAHAIDAPRRTDVARLFGVGPRNAVVPSWLQQGSRALAEEVARKDGAVGIAGGDLAKGERVGPWRIERTLGRGGQSTVYLAAHQGKPGLRAALKVPRAEVAARLMREARILERLQHPRIVKLLDACFDGPIPYLAMEHLACGSMADGIEILRARPKGSHYSPERLFAIAAGVLEALQFAHEQGVVHRDVKPANILFDGEGRVKVGDFGIGAISLAAAERASGEESGRVPGEGSLAGELARGEETPPRTPPAEGSSLAQSVAASAAGLPGGGGTLFVGTPAYMAPEQEDPRKAEHGKVDGRADLFALGKALYEAMTLRSPRTIRPIPVDRPDLAAEWDAFILRLVEERPEDRPTSAAAARELVVALAIRSGYPKALLPGGGALPFTGPILYPLDPPSKPVPGPAPEAAPPVAPGVALADLAREAESSRRRADEEVHFTDATAYSKGYQDAMAAAARARTEETRRARLVRTRDDEAKAIEAEVRKDRAAERAAMATPSQSGRRALTEEEALRKAGILMGEQAAERARRLRRRATVRVAAITFTASYAVSVAVFLWLLGGPERSGLAVLLGSRIWFAVPGFFITTGGLAAFLTAMVLSIRDGWLRYQAVRRPGGGSGPSSPPAPRVPPFSGAPASDAPRPKTPPRPLAAHAREP